MLRRPARPGRAVSDRLIPGRTVSGHLLLLTAAVAVAGLSGYTSSEPPPVAVGPPPSEQARS